MSLSNIVDGRDVNDDVNVEEYETAFRKSNYFSRIHVLFLSYFKAPKTLTTFKS